MNVEEEQDEGTEYCPSCGARLVPAVSGPACPRLGSCGRGGMLEGIAVEILRPSAGLSSAHA